MDEKDTVILRELQKNSRIATRVLRRCTAVIDYSAAGVDGVAVILSLKITPERGLVYDGIAAQIARFLQVEFIFLLTGIYDLQVIIRGQSMAEVSRFVVEQIASIEDVWEIMTQIVMRIYKDQGVEMSRPGSRDRQLISF